MSPPRDLFDESDDDSEKRDLTVNRKFARAYTSRKQQEELRNYQQEDDSSSSSESEDEDADLLSPSVDVSILKTIHALRNKDSSIYDSSTRFFPQVEEENESSSSGSDSEEKSPRKPKRFKDVLREQILEQMDGEKKLAASPNKEEANPLEYDQEQRALRSAFLESSGQNDDEEEEDDWMVLKKRAKKQEDEEADKLIQEELQALEEITTGDSTLKDPRGEIEDGEKFLLDFIKHKKWIDKDQHDDSDSDDESDNGKQHVNNDSDDDSMNELEKADDFESKYNFRFEEAASKSGADFSVMSYARSGTMNTLRRKDDTRKRKRSDRKERKAAERKAKEEQLRRLKNAKREEMEQKLNQVKAVLGQVEQEGKTVDEATMLRLMEGDYDPDKFEQMMNETYGDDFYQQEDSEWKTDADVRESLLKDEDGNMIVGYDDEEGGLYDNGEDVEEYGEGDDTEYNEDWNEEEEYHDEEDYARDEETETEKKLKEKMMDELYKLDYEDMIDGMPTRFKYRSVEKNDYGLSAEEILYARDSTLKSFVSLKKMAPYREDGEHHVGSKKRRRFREMMKQDLEEEMEKQEEEEVGEGSNPGGEEDVPQKKKKRRRQKKGKKKDKETVDEAVVETVAKAKDEDEAIDDVETKIKRKRKKKGKKVSKDDDVEVQVSNDVPSTEGNEGTASKKSEASETVSEKTKKAKHKSLNPEKKKRKRKKVKVEGVSSSRLAAYNL